MGQQLIDATVGAAIGGQQCVAEKHAPGQKRMVAGLQRSLQNSASIVLHEAVF